MSRSCGRLIRCPEKRQTQGSRISPGTFWSDSRNHSEHQDQNPLSGKRPDRRRLEEGHARKVPTFALTADVSEAHRQIPIAEQVPGGSVFINTVGTFGVASASNVLPQHGRLAQYLAGSSAYTWHMLVADDYHLDAGGANYRTALFHFFTLAQQGTYLCHGARLRGVMWFRGWGLNSSTEFECSESRQEGPIG